MNEDKMFTLLIGALALSAAAIAALQMFLHNLLFKKLDRMTAAIFQKETIIQADFTGIRTDITNLGTSLRSDITKLSERVAVVEANLK